MITISIVLNFIGGFVFYHLSQKDKVRNPIPLFNWLNQNQKQSKVIGVILFCIALFLNIISFGLTSGILFWFFLLSLILCLIIVLNPLKIINYTLVGVFVFLCLITEIFIK